MRSYADTTAGSPPLTMLLERTIFWSWTEGIELKEIFRYDSVPEVD